MTLLAIILFIFTIFLFFYSRQSLPVCDYKLHMIFGKKGSGKSTILTRLAMAALAHGQPVYSTLPIPGTFLFNGKDFGSFHIPENSLVLIDEIGMVFDPRNFKDLKPYVRDIFKLQRHYKLTVYIFSQTWDDTDKKLRDLTDQLWYSKKIFGSINIMQHISKVIKFPGPDSPKYGEIVEGYFLDFFLIPGSRTFTYMPKYWKLFDSFTTPELPAPKEGSIIYLPPCDSMPKNVLKKIKAIQDLDDPA